MAALADGLPVFLSNKVSKVQYAKEGACVHTPTHYFEGIYVFHVRAVHSFLGTFTTLMASAVQTDSAFYFV